MALTVLTLSCFLFYRCSRYFPLPPSSVIEKNKKWALLIATILLMLSLVFFASTMDFATALIIWMIAWMTILSALILSIKMYPSWTWVWGVLCLLFIAIDVI